MPGPQEVPLEASRGNTTETLSKREGVGRHSKSVLAEPGGVSPQSKSPVPGHRWAEREAGVGLGQTLVPLRGLWPFKSAACGPAGQLGLEMTVVRPEDSGEQPGSRFDVTLGLDFSGFHGSPRGGLVA